jgi:hypothetical protein
MPSTLIDSYIKHAWIWCSGPLLAGRGAAEKVGAADSKADADLSIFHDIEIAC